MRRHCHISLHAPHHSIHSLAASHTGTAVPSHISPSTHNQDTTHIHIITNYPHMSISHWYIITIINPHLLLLPSCSTKMICSKTCSTQQQQNIPSHSETLCVSHCSTFTPHHPQSSMYVVAAASLHPTVLHVIDCPHTPLSTIMSRERAVKLLLIPIHTVLFVRPAF